MTKSRDLANAATALNAVTAGELTYLDGVTSAIQTQMDAKAPSSTAVTLTGTQTLTNKTLTSPALTTPTISTATTNGDILYGTGSGALARLGIGTTGQILNVTAGVPAWATPSSGTPAFSGVLLTGTSAQTIASTTATLITFNTETYDTDSYHNNSTNTSRITIPSGKSGYYLITFMVSWAVNGGDGHRTVYIKKNTSTYLHGGASVRPSGVVNTSVMYTIIANLSATDYIELEVYQSGAGGNLNVDKDSTYLNTYFNAQYLGA
jgi:hypothetical protein